MKVCLSQISPKSWNLTASRSAYLTSANWGRTSTISIFLTLFVSALEFFESVITATALQVSSRWCNAFRALDSARRRTLTPSFWRASSVQKYSNVLPAPSNATVGCTRDEFASASSFWSRSAYNRASVSVTWSNSSHVIDSYVVFEAAEVGYKKAFWPLKAAPSCRTSAPRLTSFGFEYRFE